ncbi:MAG: hypothetical protein R2726_18650 [Acidimicrobiales bacterium]
MSDITIDIAAKRAPRALDELGIPDALVQDLTLRRALFEGRTSTFKLAENLCLSPQLMNKVVEELRDLRYLEVIGLDGMNYILELSETGRGTALERMNLCRYAGAAPVSLADYVAQVNSQTAAPKVTRQAMREAFADLVVNDVLLDELGPALIAEGAMFLYGPPGTGKTSIAERLIRIHDDPILVPRAVEVDSQIISVFDPVIHRALDDQPEDLDPRWVLCERPSIIAGGELTQSMLDLTHEPTNGIYLAPVQMQAAGGVLVIDDFGRQVMTPEQLLNRWIVPLDRRLDYLSLSYGVKFEIPFDCKVVFSTNLEPATLGDEAFFRRIQNKILVPGITDAEFDEVLHRVARAKGIAIAPGAEEHLRTASRERGDGDLRPYLPGAVCTILTAVADYFDVPSELTPAMIDRVVAVYFTQNREVTDGTVLAGHAMTARSTPPMEHLAVPGAQQATPSGPDGDAGLPSRQTAGSL